MASHELHVRPQREAAVAAYGRAALAFAAAAVQERELPVVPAA